MRIDHHAYQRATKVAGFGLLLQVVIGVTLLTFGLLSIDTAFQFAALYVLPGILVWLGLIILFHQHKLERLEVLEEDELAASRGATDTIFDRAADESRVAARRLGLMHRWFMPALSLLLALILAGFGWGLWRYMSGVRGGAIDFFRTEERGWAVAICLGAAAVSFIFSRFVAGMAKHAAWQNLRGGAAYMVGNSVVLIAVAIGIMFRFFEGEGQSRVIVYIGWAIPVLMVALAINILLNFILNLYRPRIHGEVPRPAFDSKALSLLAAPDNIVRSLNEAMNYQFGFDVASSWGYQLLLRSVVALAALAVVALVLLSTMVVVEPHEQAIKLRGGAIVGNRVHGSGVMWKWPWPFETAQVHDVTRIRSLHLTPRVRDPVGVAERDQVVLWNQPDPPPTDYTIEPFIVGNSPIAAPPMLSPVPIVPGLEAVVPAIPTAGGLNDVVVAAAATQPSTEEQSAAIVSASYSLVDAEIVLQYRVRQTEDGLLDFLRFAPENVARMQNLTTRERALRTIALGVVSSHLARLSLDNVLAHGGQNLSATLVEKVKAAFDEAKTGVEVVSIDLPMLRPSGSSAPHFEEMNVSAQARQEVIVQYERGVERAFAELIGEAALTEPVLKGINEYNQLAREHGADSPAALTKRQEVENLLLAGAGEAAQTITRAERDRWVSVLNQSAHSSRVQSQREAFRAAPRLYAERERMRILSQYLPGIQKYILAIDPNRVNVNMDLTTPESIFNFAGASEEEQNKQ